MLFKNADRRRLTEIEKKLEYQTKLIESIYETIDESKHRSDNKKNEMVNYFSSVMDSIESMGGNMKAPIMRPLNDMLERLKQ